MTEKLKLSPENQKKLGRPRKNIVSSTDPENPEVTEDKKAIESLKNEAANVTDQKPESETKYKKKKRLELEEQQKAAENLKNQALGITQFLSSGLDIICVRLPNPKPLTLFEKKMFEDSAAQMIAKYMPSMLLYGAELSFSLSLIMILAPRIVKPKKSKEVKAEPEQKEEKKNAEPETNTDTR
jgi:hypothetical protein